MALGGCIDYFRDTVFNYPTMAECYKVAAFDGINRLGLDQVASSTDAKPVTVTAPIAPPTASPVPAGDAVVA